MVNRLGRVFQVILSPVWRDSGSPLYAYKVFVGLFFLASGMWLMYRLGPERLIIRYFLLTLAAFAFFGFSHTGEGGILDLMFLSLDMAGRLLFPAILLHLALSFPAGGRLGRGVKAMVYGPVVLTGLLVLWLGPLGGALRLSDPVRALELAGTIELLAAGAYLTTAFMVLAIRSTRATLPSDHRQLRWTAWGAGIGALPYVLLYLIPQGLGVETPVAADLSMLPLILIPLSFSTAILKYRLADLSLFVKSGVTALVLALFSLALFLLFNLALRLTLGLPGIDRRVFTILAAVFVFLLYPYMRRVVGEGIDRAFYLGHYDYRRTLQEFARELNAERELLPLTIRFHDRIRQTLPVSRSVLLLPENGGLRLLDDSCPLGGEQDADLIPERHALVASLQEEDSVHLDREARHTLPPGVRRLGLDSFFPMRVKGRLVAVLAVALKDAGAEMNSEDRQLLVTLAAHAASSIEGARLYEENVARIREVGQLKDYNESIVESSRVGILVLGRDRRIRVWNRTMSDLFGHARDEVRDRPAADFFPPAFVALLDSLPPAGRRVDRFSLPGMGPPQRLFNMALAAMHGSHGGFVVTFDEVTEQVRIEEQLVQAERLAAVGLLASGVAHEINTPLTGIASYAQMLLEDTPEDDPAREYLERIRKQSWRASHIANSLLNFSRGGGDAFTRVDLNAIVDETLALFGPQLKGRSIAIKFTPSPDPPLVNGHQGRLQQVLLNLLLNARDAMAAGGEIRIHTALENGRVGLHVADTGEGISSENLSRIYDPFFTTKGAGAGTGLGLSVTYGIVKDHDGSLTVRSRPGEGTVFSLHLPAWQADRKKQVSA
jgi:signal transduction histidine kinase